MPNNNQQPEPEKESELLEGWEMTMVSFCLRGECGNGGRMCKGCLGIQQFIKHLLATQAKKSFQEGAASQKEKDLTLLNQNIANTILFKINEYTMLRNLDGQYQQALSEMAFMAEEEIIKLLNQ